MVGARRNFFSRARSLVEETLYGFRNLSVVAFFFLFPLSVPLLLFMIRRIRFLFLQIEDRSSDEGSFGDYRRRVVTAASLDSPDDAPIAREHGQEGGTPQRSTVYPVGLARPNFIVDLMDVPGDLIPIGSPRAKLYRAAKRTCDTIRCR